MVTPIARLTAGAVATVLARVVACRVVRARGGLSIIDFCAQEPADAQLLVAFRHDDLVRAAPTGAVAQELEDLNGPVEQAVVDLARGLYGRATRAALDRVLLAVFDLPYGAVRRHLIAGKSLPPALREDLERAIAAVVDQCP